MCEVRHPGAGGGHEIPPDRRKTHHRVWRLPCLYHIDLDVFGSIHRRSPEQRHPRDHTHRGAGIRSEHRLGDSGHDQRLRRVVHAGARGGAPARHRDLADRARRLHALLHFPQSLPRLTARQAPRTPPISHQAATRLRAASAAGGSLPRTPKEDMGGGAAMMQGSHARNVVGWGAGLLAGVGAGVVAALAGLAVGAAMRASIPPPLFVAWSAFAAGVLGGLLYAWLSRLLNRPAPAFWIITLALATIDSALIAFLPMPAVASPVRLPIVGLIVPLRQLAALVGIGRLGERH